MRSATNALVAALATLATFPALAAGDINNQTPFEVLGDPAPNVITITMTSNLTIEMCVDGFCSEESADLFDTIIVRGGDGNDTITINQQSFLTNFRGGILVIVEGDAADDTFTMCDGGCPDAAIDSTTFTPGAAPGEARLVQTSGTETLEVVLESVSSAADFSPGTLTVNGTAGDDVVTYGAAGPGQGLVTVDGLLPLTFANKPTLTLAPGAGADRVEVDGPATPDGLAGDCGDGRPVCVVGGSSAGDRLVVHGVDGQQDEALLSALGRGVFGEPAGTLDGIAATAGLRHEGFEALDVVLAHGTDTDRLSVAGTPGNDRFTVAPDGATRRVAIDALLDQDAPGAFALPSVSVVGADTAGVALVDVRAGEGTDEVVLAGGERDDAIALAPAGDTAELRHQVDGRPTLLLTGSGVERQAAEGGAGDDALRVRGNLPATVGWAGGTGSDVLGLDGSGAGPVMVGLAAATLREDGFGAATASGTETLDVDAAGARVDVSGGDADETLRFAPSGPGSGRVTVDGLPALAVRGAGQTLRLDAAAGRDTVVVRGGSTADEIPVTREASAGTLTAQVGGTLPVRVGAAAEAVRLEGAEGADRFLVTGSGGPETATVDGGADPAEDRLVMTDGVADAAVRYGHDPSSGTVATASPPVGFLALERVDLEGEGPGTLTVHGSDAPDALTQTANTVAAGGGALVAFTRFATLALEAGAAADDVRVDPRGTSLVERIAVAGGESADDALTVHGTNLADAVRYAPDAPDGGRVAVAGAPPVDLTGTESVRVDGRSTVPSGDALVVDTRAIAGAQVLEPGAAFDAGTIRFDDGSGSTRTGPPLAFAGLGAGSVRLDDDGRDARLVVDGTNAADTVTVAGDGSVRRDARVPVLTPGVHTLVLRGLDGEDAVSLPAGHPFPGADGGPGIVADGAGPDSGDSVTVSGGSAPLQVDLDRATVRADGFADVSVPGVERLAVNGAGALAVAGGDQPDVLRYTPTGAQAGTVSRDGARPELRFTGVAGALRADGGAGSDSIVVDGRSGDDETLVTRGETTSVRVAGLKQLDVPAATEALVFQGGDGSDTTRVTGSGGPAALTLAGGAPTVAGDRIVLESPTAAVTYGISPDGGTLDTPGGPVRFAETEQLDVQGDGSGELTVRGSDDGDAVALGGQATPQIRVDQGAVVEHHGYPSMVVDGRGGDDVLDVSYVGLGDLRAVRVSGGTGLGDELRIQDRPGQAGTLQVRPTAPDAGAFSMSASPAALTFDTAEALTVDGQGSGDELRLVTPAGAQRLRLTPEATDDAGRLQLETLVPVAFLRLGDGRVRVTDAAGSREDTLALSGTPGADAFRVIGDPNAVVLGSRVPVIPDAAAHLVLDGFDGDDAFALTGPLPFSTTRTDGAGPDRDDAVAITGPSGPVVADLGAGTVTGYGGTVAVPGIERLATDVGGGMLTQVGTAGDDAMCFDPQSPRSGLAYRTGGPGGGSISTVCAPDQRGTNLLHSFTDVADFVVDPAAGADQVIVNGTAASDLVSVRLTHPRATVAVHPGAPDPLTLRLTAQVVTDSTESLAVAADESNDVFELTAFDNPAPNVLLDGEGPSPKRFGDELRLRDGTGRAQFRNVTGHEFGTGTVFADYRYGHTQRIDYLGIENVTSVRDPKR